MGLTSTTTWLGLAPSWPVLGLGPCMVRYGLVWWLDSLLGRGEVEGSRSPGEFDSNSSSGLVLLGLVGLRSGVGESGITRGRLGEDPVRDEDEVCRFRFWVFLGWLIRTGLVNAVELEGKLLEELDGPKLSRRALLMPWNFCLWVATPWSLLNRRKQRLQTAKPIPLAWSDE